MYSIEKEISSAEMTCTWRCDEPDISNDTLSINLATPDGISKAREYQKTQYPLAPRHFSVRAGFFLKYALQLISTKQFDSIISLGSGLSLLTHCIALSADSNKVKLIYIDSDIENMMKARIKYLNNNSHALPSIKNANRMENMILNVEEAYMKSLLTNQLLCDFLPKDCLNPIIILEGLVYFLSEPCLKWVLASLESYPNYAVIFDYWPEDAPQKSIFFEKVLAYFKTSLPENVKSLTPQHILSKYTKLIDYSLNEAEQEMFPIGKTLLTNPDTYIPARICVLKK